ncbi:MAG: 30S ribosomal protein S5 [Parcubacteria group bacterium GW2011_GWA2_47_8]|nr:MAG: 30S ribosomal protein S5 [Parcubacteria group bacterium GW2011_GWA2_47_8]OHB20420.1 MAG: hypothetical protein A2666_01930 [Parcubacteria group bacterium RIFCSPHIGHO2_01_FULL_47_10b]
MNKQQHRKPRVPREKDEFGHQLIQLDRVTRVTKGGKRFSFRALVVVGNKKGKVGVGMQKGVDVSSAIEKAVKQAKRQMIDLPIVKGTIPFQIRKKYNTAIIFMKPLMIGKGIIAGSVVRHICELGGISNINVKIIGRTKNKANNAIATMNAFRHMIRVYNMRQTLSGVRVATPQPTPIAAPITPIVIPVATPVAKTEPATKPATNV